MVSDMARWFTWLRPQQSSSPLHWSMHSLRYPFRKSQGTIDEIREQWTDPAPPQTTPLPTLQLTEEDILTLHVQLEQKLGTRIAGFLARVFRLRPQNRDRVA